MPHAPVGDKKGIKKKGREGPWGCETSRLLHFLDNRLTDGGEVVSLYAPAALYPSERFLVLTVC
jgi:hypothetical protein